MIKTWTLGVATASGLATLLLATSAQAIVLASRPVDPVGLGYTSISGGLQIAQSFYLAQASTGTAFTFYGFHTDSGNERPGSSSDAYLEQPNSFDLLFFNDDGLSMPTTSPFFSMTTGALTGTATADTSGFGNEIYEWTTSIPSVGFVAEGNYWVSIRGRNPSFIWSHSSLGGDDNAIVRYSDTEAWQQLGSGELDAMAFTLEGEIPSAVPEPSAMAILGMGLLGSALIRRRRRTV